jgi:hypothetical protein
MPSPIAPCLSSGPPTSVICPRLQKHKLFISRIAALPKGVPVSLDEALQPSLDDEAELRRLFATDTKNPRLSNPHVGLVDVFDAPADIRTTRARVVQNEFDLSEKYLMPLTEARRRKEGTPAMASSLEEFNQNWSIFSEGSLSLLDWNNVVAAGGSVLACLLPVPDANKASKRTLRKYFHSTAFPTSDIDLFLYGLTPEQAEAKIIAIFQGLNLIGPLQLHLAYIIPSYQGCHSLGLYLRPNQAFHFYSL